VGELCVTHEEKLVSISLFLKVRVTTTKLITKT